MQNVEGRGKWEEGQGESSERQRGKKKDISKKDKKQANERGIESSRKHEQNVEDK